MGCPFIQLAQPGHRALEGAVGGVRDPPAARRPVPAPGQGEPQVPHDQGQVGGGSRCAEAYIRLQQRVLEEYLLRE